MLNSSFSPWPSFTEEEAEAVKKVVLSNKVNYWTGEECRHFEAEFANYVGCKYAISLANGTVALEIALKTLNLSAGDEVIVTARTFVASASSIVNAGGIPVFADVNQESQNIDANTINRKLSEKTKAILCVHLAGWPCDMTPIMKLAREKGLFVIEDCAQAHGALYKGKSVGSIGDIGCWSFCQDKIITTGGEGGMVTTNDEKLWYEMWSLKDHGKSWRAVHEKQHPPGFRWVHESFGSNLRMTEMQAAIGRIQLKQLPAWHLQRNKNAQKIWTAANKTACLIAPKLSCTGCDGLCEGQDKCSHAAYKCYVFVNGSEKERNEIMAAINAEGVPCYQGSCSEVYFEKAFEKLSVRPSQRLPVAKALGETSLMFLCHPTLTEEEIEKTCLVIKQVCTKQLNH